MLDTSKIKVNEEKLTKIKRSLGQCNLREVGLLQKYLKDRHHILFWDSIHADELVHKKRIQALSIGTKVIAKHGSRAGEIGKIAKHGRKYVCVDFGDEYAWWQLDYKEVDEKIDDELIKENAELNKRVQGTLGKIFGGGD